MVETGKQPERMRDNFLQRVQDEQQLFRAVFSVQK